MSREKRLELKPGKKKKTPPKTNRVPKVKRTKKPPVITFFEFEEMYLERLYSLLRIGLITDETGEYISEKMGRRIEADIYKGAHKSKKKSFAKLKRKRGFYSIPEVNERLMPAPVEVPRQPSVEQPESRRPTNTPEQTQVLDVPKQEALPVPKQQEEENE